MGNIELPYVQSYKTKGKTYHYYRRGGRKYRVEGMPGSVEFAANYQRIHGTFERAVGGDFAPGTFAALFTEYRTSPEYLELAPRTRIDYRLYLDRMQENFGSQPVAGIQRQDILRYRDQLAGQPRSANYTITVLARVLAFGVDRGYRDANPARKIDKLKTGPGYRAWKPWELKRILEVAPQEIADMVMLALYTGQRQSDLVAMRWAQIDGGMIDLTQQKTSQRILVPIHSALAARLEVIKARPVRSVVQICTTATGRPWTANHLRHRFKATLATAELEGVHFHGFRKTAAKNLAEAGCTTKEIMAITGHQTGQMIDHYTRDADQTKNARAAMAKLELSNTAE